MATIGKGKGWTGTLRALLFAGAVLTSALVLAQRLPPLATGAFSASHGDHIGLLALRAEAVTASIWINWIVPLVLCEIALQWRRTGKAGT